MELKKSYKGFIIWLIVFCVCMFGCAFLPIKDSDIVGRIVLNVCVIAMALLAFIIYKTGYVYWYNGTTYEEALEAGAERRKNFAWKHFRDFGLFALAFLVFSVIAQILNIGLWNDIVIATVGIIVVAIGTIRFKL